MQGTGKPPESLSCQVNFAPQGRDGDLREAGSRAEGKEEEEEEGLGVDGEGWAATEGATPFRVFCLV